MTDKDYDPFSYGQVRMAPGQAGSGAPEDILFASGGPATQSVVSDSSWDPPADTSSEFSAVDFGSDILGVQSAASAAPARAAVAPAPAVTNSGIRKAAAAKPAAPAAPTSVKSSRIEKVGAAPGVQGEAARPAANKPKSVTVPAVTPIEMPSRARGAMLVSIGIVLTGAGVASWLQFSRHNMVLAGIAGAFALALAGVAWFGLKR